MKKNIWILLFVVSSIGFGQRNLKFEILEKNNTDIKIIIRPDTQTVDSKVDREERAEKVVYDANTYIVKPGDTIFKISKKVGMRASELMELNNLRNGAVIRVGQVLKISVPKSETKNSISTNTNTGKLIKTRKVYIVKKGDTLAKISREFGISVDELMRINDKLTPELEIGERIIVGEKVSTAPVEKVTQKPVAQEKGVERIYIVKRGDTLAKISRKFGVSIDELMEQNGLLTSNLEVGQGIKVKVKNQSKKADNGAKYYTVRRGDTLYSIARRFGISLDRLMKINNLDNGATIEINQRLRVN